MKQAPSMTKKDIKDRLEWAMDHIGWDTHEWKSVVFSDEKKFNLD